MALKKFLSILMVCVMGAGAMAACAPDASAVQDEDGHTAEYEELQIFKSDYTIPAEETMSRIKAEYLIENQGYRDDDRVSAILSLNGDAVIDGYLADAEASAKYSLAEYAAGEAGKQIRAGIDFAQTDLIRMLQSEGLIESVEYRYSTVINAVAVTMTYGNFRVLEEAGLCKSVALAETYSHPQEAEGADASGFVNDVDVYETGIFKADKIKDAAGNEYTGKGTSVAVLDSGFDLSHAAFNTHDIEGTPMFSQSDIENKVNLMAADGTHELKAAQTTPGLAITDVYYSKKIPYKYDYADKDSDVFPYDSEHGTHVAGIIGGYAASYQEKDGTVPMENGEPIPFRGIARDTQLVLLKVFPDLQTGAQTPDILAALEDSVLLGVDAINMSLGAACGFTREKDGDVVNEVYDKINESGTSLIIAAGNEYSSGFGGEQGNTNRVTNPDSGTVGSPGSYPASLTVASISGVKSKYLVGNDEQVVFFNESSSIAGDENDFFGELYEDMGWAKDGTEHTLEYITIPGYGYQANYNGLNLAGKIALISRGDNTFEDKALQAKIAGAAACVIYNNIEGDIRMSMGKTDHVPTVSISKEDGVRLAQNRTGTFTFSYDQQAGPFMSDFSCWGPLPDLSLKPEITAHGGNITSSVPGGGYDTISGTSMACPNLCGIVILIRQYIKDNYEALTGKTDTQDASYMKNIKNLTNKLLMSTAGIVVNEQGNPYSPRKQGAGLASLFNAVKTKSYLEIEDGKGNVQERTKVELGDDAKKTGVYTMYINIVNVSQQAAAYEAGIIGMTESVSTADDDFVAERDRILGGATQVEKLGGEGTVNGTSVSVNAKSTLKLKVTYTLSQEDKDLIENSFPYGMYVEGFVTFKAVGEEESDIDLNTPFLAFYGDWTQAPIFDKTYYEVESEAHNHGIDEEDKIKADYYATTPYGSYRFNYIIPLGTYLYTMDEGAYDAIPASEDRIAISDEYSTLDGISAVYAGVLRSCKTMTYTVTDKATGEVVYVHEVTNARKAFSQGGSPIPNYEQLHISTTDLGLLNNRQYEFKMEGLLDYGTDGGRYTNARNKFTFDFTVDTEAPVIKSATYEKVYDKTKKKDRFYINLTIHDNTYAMALLPGIFTENPDYEKNPTVEALYQFTTVSPLPIPLYGEKGEDYTVRYEITDLLPNIKYDSYLPNTLVFALQDYALNECMYVCRLPGAQGDFKFTENGGTEDAELTEIDVEVGKVLDLTQYLTTTDTANADYRDYLKYLTWNSENRFIAEVQDGQVRGIAVGSTTITVRDPLVYNGAYIKVNVIAPPAEQTPAEPPADTPAETAQTGNGRAAAPLAAGTDINGESIEEVRFSYFDTTKAYAQAGEGSDIGATGDRIFLTAATGGIEMYPGESIRLNYDVSPWYVKYAVDENRKSKYQFTYQSNRPDIVTVDQNGNVTAQKKGNAIVTLSVSGSNLTATLRITVNSEFIINESRTLVGYKGMGGDVVIPDDEGILYIGPFCFSLYETDDEYRQELPEDDIYANRIPQSNNTIRSVVVPEGVMEIQQNAFYHCTALEEVKLPSTIQFIRQNAFTGDVNLKKINLNRDVEVVGANAFDGCTSLNDFGDGVATDTKPLGMGMCYSIGAYAFRNCTSLTNLDLTGLRNTGTGAFMGCTNLTQVKFHADGLTKLSEHIFDGCGLKEVVCYESNIIPAYAFANNRNMTSFTFANATGKEGLDLIGDYAFANDVALTAITLPNSAFTLGNRVFSGCSNLKTVTLQAKTEIDAAQGAIFAGCGLETFALAEGAEAVYRLEDGGKQLLKGSMLYLAATDVYTGDLTLSAAVTSVRGNAFAGTKITSVTFGGPVTLGDYAFAECRQLKTVTFADGSNEIGSYAFAGCNALTSIDLSKAVKVGDHAFENDTAMRSVTLAGGTFGEAAFKNSGITDVSIVKDSVFGAEAFANCKSLTAVTMPAEGGVRIGARCFYGDNKLTAIDLGKLSQNAEIGDETFYGCSALAAADLTNVKKVGENAFAGCAALAAVTVGDDLTEIGAGAFMDVNYYVGGGNSHNGPIFTAIDLKNVTSIGEAAFFGCRNLTSVTIPGGITALADNVFAYCAALKTVTLSGVTEIGNFTFAGCAALDTVDLSRVRKIGAGAFYQAARLAATDLLSVREIGSLAFADAGVSGTVTAPELTALTPTILDRNVIRLSASEIAIPEIGIALPKWEDKTKVDLGDYVFAGSYAFRNTQFTTFDAPKLAEIGEGAFSGNTQLTAFNFSTSLAGIGEHAFEGCTALADFTFGANKTAEGKINDYAHLAGGVLYTALQNGKQQLASVPAGKVIETLTVEEGTTYIDAYAGNANKNIKAIVLPDSLESIGVFAFYGYTALQNVEFRSINAPGLESGSVTIRSRLVNNSYYVYEIFDAKGKFLCTVVEEGDPGYDILCSQQSMRRTEQMTYFNFIGLVGKNEPIHMTLPANDGLTGYDDIVYSAYFGPVADAARSGYTAMEQAMKEFLNYGTLVSAIETVTLNDEALISKAVVALNGISQDPAAYGVDTAEWERLTSAVTAARERIVRLKIEYAKKIVRDIQARIDALSATYSDTKEQNEEIRSLREAIESLDLDDRNLLVQDKYTALLAAYEAAHPDTETPPDVDTPDGGMPGWAWAIIGVGIAAVIAGAAVAVILILKKKSPKTPEAQDGQTDADEAAEPEEAAETAEPDEAAEAEDAQETEDRQD